MIAKSNVLAVLAMCGTAISPILNTSAWAAPSPMNDTTGLSPQEVCDEVLRPNDPNSEFQTEPVNLLPGPWVNDGPPEVGDPIGDPYGAGSVSYDTIFLTDGFYRNGGSPNVWGGGTARKVWSQTGQMFDTSQHQIKTTTFGCRVWKYVGPPTAPILNEPPGLQSTGNSAIEEMDVPGEPVEQLSEDDFYELGVEVNALICISPNKATKGKPGTWTGKNGFDPNGCDAASAAAGGTVPSNNAPFI